MNPHSHEVGWNLLIYGKKRWKLKSPLFLSTHVCLQEAGELIWIPEHWTHEVVSLEDSFGVALQGIGGGPPPALLASLAAAAIFVIIILGCCCIKIKRGIAGKEKPL